MNGNEIIELARRTYLEEFAQFVVKAAGQVSDGMAEQQTLRGEDATLFRGLYRVDFMGKDKGATLATELVPDRRVRLDTPVMGSAGAMQVRMEQIVWDDVGIQHDAPGDLTKALTPWFEHWFDPEDKRQPAGGSKFVDVIHALSVEPGVLHVDFGSASPDAFWALVMVLRDAGATRMTIRETRPPPRG
jgi:hypothetical protein